MVWRHTACAADSKFSNRHVTFESGRPIRIRISKLRRSLVLTKIILWWLEIPPPRHGATHQTAPLRAHNLPRQLNNLNTASFPRGWLRLVDPKHFPPYTWWLTVPTLAALRQTVAAYTRSSADADNRLDAFSGQSRSTNIVPFHMLHIVSHCAIVTCL